MLKNLISIKYENRNLPLARRPAEVPKGDWPGNIGYGPALWNAWEKFGLYIAVGAEPVVVLAIPSPLSGVPNPLLDTLKNICCH